MLRPGGGGSHSRHPLPHPSQGEAVLPQPGGRRGELTRQRTTQSWREGATVFSQRFFTELSQPFPRRPLITETRSDAQSGDVQVHPGSRALWPMQAPRGPRKPGLWEESGILVGPGGGAERPPRKLSSGPYRGGDPGKGCGSPASEGPGEQEGLSRAEAGPPFGSRKSTWWGAPVSPRVGDGQCWSQISGSGHSSPAGALGPHGLVVPRLWLWL